MKFFLDENFPKSAADMLQDLGHEVESVVELGCKGATDTMVFRLAQDRQAIFLTTDRDFFHTIPHTTEHHHGVVVVALNQPNRMRILERMRWFVDHFGNQDLSNRVFELRDQKCRHFPPR